MLDVAKAQTPDDAVFQMQKRLRDQDSRHPEKMDLQWVDVNLDPDSMEVDLSVFKETLGLDGESLISATFKMSDEIKDGRLSDEIFKHGTSEMGELAIEIAIENGTSYKEPGADGMVGEAVDVIICMLDLIRKKAPHLTEADLVRIAQPKLEKWKRKVIPQEISIRFEQGTYRDPWSHETLTDCWVARDPRGAVVGIAKQSSDLESQFDLVKVLPSPQAPAARPAGIMTRLRQVFRGTS
jgi:hypothetical protein